MGRVARCHIRGSRSSGPGHLPLPQRRWPAFFCGPDMTAAQCGYLAAALRFVQRIMSFGRGIGVRLFADRERTDVGPAVYGEAHYRYLDRTARPEFAAVRTVLQQWLAEYPRFHRRELVRRLSLVDDVHFEAAFFELYTYRLLRAFSPTRIRVHPKLRTSSARPDFEVAFGRAPTVLVESVTVDEVSREARAARARLQDVYNALNKVAAPDYFLHVEDYGRLRSPVPGKPLRRHVQQFINGLSYESVRAAASDGVLAALPRTVFEHDDWRIVVSVIPVSPAHRGDPAHRPVGMIGPGEPYWVDHHTPLRDAVRKKARKFGRLRRPLVICVNAAGLHIEKIDVIQALFGTEQFVIHQDPDPSKREPQLQRKPDGAFRGPRGPQNTRVSAVLVVSSLLPWTVSVHEPALYLNPWARHPLGNHFSALTTHKPVGNRLVEQPGQPVAELLGLPEAWPFSLAPAEDGREG